MAEHLPQNDRERMIVDGAEMLADLTTGGKIFMQNPDGSWRQNSAFLERYELQLEMLSDRSDDDLIATYEKALAKYEEVYG